MNSEFQKTNLGKLITFANGKLSPARFDNGIFTVFGSNGVIGKANESNSPPNSIIIGRVGSYCGAVHLSRKACWVTDNAIKATAKEDNDPSYLFYLLKKLDLNNWRSGSGQPLINQSTLNAIEIRVPAPPEQRAIGGFVAALDDRITLLRETNATLEAIAQALFKSWFVDFDPVRAKQEGRAPEGMNEATAALFPDGFEESELGAVPRGWRLTSLKEAVRIFDSKRVPLSGAERMARKGEFPYYGAAALMDYVNDYLFDGVFLLLGEDGSVTDADGYPVTQYVWGKMWVNNHAHVLQGANGISTEHLMLAIKRINIQPFVTGAVQAKLSQGNMWRIPFLMPTTGVAEAFGSLIAPLFDSYRQNAEQAQTLTALRDTLLPRLVSGQLRLPETEAALEAAA